MSKFLDYTGLTYLIGKFKKVAFTGSYNDLTDKPTIPPSAVVDSALSSSSENPVQNKVIHSALSTKITSAQAISAISEAGYATSANASSIASAIVSSGGYLTEITSAAVTSALTYTPASSSHTHEYLPLSGGTLTGELTVGTASSTKNISGTYNITADHWMFAKAFRCNTSYGLHRDVDNDQILIYGGTTIANGAFLRLFGKNHRNNGQFSLGAVGTSTYSLQGKADGTLTWNGGTIIATTFSGIATSANHAGSAADATTAGYCLGDCAGNAATTTKLKNSRNLRVALDQTSAASFNGDSDCERIGVSGTLPISLGGTGATTRLSAFKALTNSSVSSPNYFVGLTTNYTEGGYVSIANAKTALGITAAGISSTMDTSAIASATNASSLGGVTATTYLRKNVASQLIDAGSANAFIDLKTSGGTYHRTMRVAAQNNGRAGLYYNLGSGTTSTGWLINIEPDGSLITHATADSATSATNAGTATKLGTASIGDANTPFYLNAGTPTKGNMTFRGGSATISGASAGITWTDTGGTAATTRVLVEYTGGAQTTTAMLPYVISSTITTSGCTVGVQRAISGGTVRAQASNESIKVRYFVYAYV